MVPPITHSTLNIPSTSGTYWIKALKNGQPITVACGHSSNMRRAIEIADKRAWLQPGLSDFWVEALADSEHKLCA